MPSVFSFPTNVLFGEGSVGELPRQLGVIGISRPLVVTDSGLVGTSALIGVLSQLTDETATFSGVHPNPTPEDVEGAFREFEQNKCDGVIAVGGGSALDVGKIVRMRVKFP